MTNREFLRHVNTDPVLRDRLVNAVKREWGGRGIDHREPYITNGAIRAVYAMMAELDELAPEDGDVSISYRAADGTTRTVGRADG